MVFIRYWDNLNIQNIRNMYTCIYIYIWFYHSAVDAKHTISYTSKGMFTIASGQRRSGTWPPWRHQGTARRPAPRYRRAWAGRKPLRCRKNVNFHFFRCLLGNFRRFLGESGIAKKVRVWIWRYLGYIYSCKYMYTTCHGHVEILRCERPWIRPAKSTPDEHLQYPGWLIARSSPKQW